MFVNPSRPPVRRKSASASPTRASLEATYRLEPSPTEKALFWCAILCSWQNESYAQAACVVPILATQPASGAKLVFAQVIGSRDILPSDGMLRLFQATQNIKTE